MFQHIATEDEVHRILGLWPIGIGFIEYPKFGQVRIRRGGHIRVDPHKTYSGVLRPGKWVDRASPTTDIEYR
jgi:hypothetical protein